MPLSQIGSYTKSYTMLMSHTWSYTISHLGILCHDICILYIHVVRMGLSDVVTSSIFAHSTFISIQCLINICKSI
ncbi:hypothetical protein F383_06027 [Gossypium arboreum]|uniref:Uncharacterized protein n=1 Tax=Gossypium arboreum TaxID=29729 RepID=A0A0B0PBI9_GOSAR|nr:hypothetical protein F383_06027 [Gossypium arboreum]